MPYIRTSLRRYSSSAHQLPPLLPPPSPRHHAMHACRTIGIDTVVTMQLAVATAGSSSLSCTFAELLSDLGTNGSSTPWAVGLHNRLTQRQECAQLSTLLLQSQRRVLVSVTCNSVGATAKEEKQPEYCDMSALLRCATTASTSAVASAALDSGENRTALLTTITAERSASCEELWRVCRRVQQGLQKAQCR